MSIMAKEENKVAVTIERDYWCDKDEAFSADGAFPAEPGCSPAWKSRWCSPPRLRAVQCRRREARHPGVTGMIVASDDLGLTMDDFAHGEVVYHEPLTGETVTKYNIDDKHYALKRTYPRRQELIDACAVDRANQAGTRRGDGKIIGRIPFTLLQTTRSGSWTPSATTTASSSASFLDDNPALRRETRFDRHRRPRRSLRRRIRVCEARDFGHVFPRFVALAEDRLSKALRFEGQSITVHADG